MPKESKKDAKPTRSSGDDRKKRRAKKDPNAPKRGLSAYMFFSQELRSKVKEDNPDASFGQIGKILGDKWKEMDDSDKAPFVAKAEKDKQRYEKEKAEHEGKE